MRQLLSAAILAAALPAAAQEFGTDADADYAAKLWQAMVEARYVGEDAISAFPYEGVEPHGMMLTTFFDEATIDGHTGTLVVKNNFGPPGVTADEVIGDPERHLEAVTIMFRREDGYDPDNANWFWAKYLPDGTLDANPAGMALAGRVAKGADQGCIACHSAEEDYLFTTNAIGMN